MRTAAADFTRRGVRRWPAVWFISRLLRLLCTPQAILNHRQARHPFGEQTRPIFDSISPPHSTQMVICDMPPAADRF